MFYVYILKSKVKKYYYVGCTEDLKRRFNEHNKGKTKSIKHLLPFTLVYYEAYNTKAQARRREIELKKSSLKKKEIIDRIEK